MRQRRVEATAGVVDARPLVGRRTIFRLGAVALVIWVAWAFAQEAWTANRLAAQAADLRSRNSALAAQNAEYKQDIATVQSGAAAEEVARSNGYSKSDERVYVVSSPAPVATPAAPVKIEQASPSFADLLRGWWSRLLAGRG